MAGTGTDRDALHRDGRHARTYSVDVAAWGPGPFDNDAAARWAGRFDDADPDERLELLRSALHTVLDGDGSDGGSEAVAAATVVAALVPDGLVFDASHGPVTVAADAVTVDTELRNLALDALRRISSAGSPWYRQWSEAGQLDVASSSLRPVAAALRS